MPRLAGTSRDRRRFVTHNAIAAGGTWSAGVFGLLLQAFISHHFRPALYGQAFAVFSFYIIITGPAAAFSRMVAWTTSRERAADAPEQRESGALLRVTNARLLGAGTLIGAGCIVAAPAIAKYLHVDASFVVLGALGTPFLLATSPLLASLQGEQRWVPWSALSLGIALSRVAFVAIFVYPFGIAGVMLGTSVGAAVIYAIALAMVWPQIREGRRQTSGWRTHWRFLVVSVASTLTMSVLVGSDVLLVEHFFSAHAGGQFSSAAVASRALYFAMNSLATVLFPVVASRNVGSRTARSAVAASVALALGGGLLGLVLFSTGGHVILRSFSGRAYEAASSYIGWYALGMPMLAAILMLSNTQQTLADLKLLWLLVPGAILKPLLIFFFHQSLLMVSLMSDVAIGALLVALAVRYVVLVRRHDRAARWTDEDQLEPRTAQELVAMQAPRSAL
jgi:O-antigen/teichoic acid export membrane protein